VLEHRVDETAVAVHGVGVEDSLHALQL